MSGKSRRGKFYESELFSFLINLFAITAPMTLLLLATTWHSPASLYGIAGAVFVYFSYLFFVRQVSDTLAVTMTAMIYTPLALLPAFVFVGIIKSLN